MKISTLLFSTLLLLTFSAFSCQDEPPVNEPDDQNQDDTTQQENPVTRVKLRFDTLAEGWQNPWGMAFLNETEMLITERNGSLYRFNMADESKTAISGTPNVVAQGQGGLLDIELHPDYATNGWIYFSYSKSVAGGANTAVGRAQLNGNSLSGWEDVYVAEPGFSGGVHFGSRVVFHEGFLYVSIGERGRMTNAQNTENPNGCIIRLHDDGRIPGDNPFVNDDEVLDEIYVYGLRNPQGMAINPITNEIWEHEHGPCGGDEVNIIRAGNNYGWPLVTFGIDYDGSIISEDTTAPGITNPIHYWDPSIAPCGMDFFQHERYGQYNGQLLVGALAHRKVQVCFIQNDDVVRTEDHLENMARFRDVQNSPDGYLYILCESPGLLLKMIPIAQ